MDNFPTNFTGISYAPPESVAEYLQENVGVANGLYNTRIGANAMPSVVTGELVVLGLNTGSNNTAIGTNSLFNNTSGFLNTAIGSNSLFNNIDGSNNVSIGGSLYNNTKGDGNVAIGTGSLYVNTEGNGNVAIGPDSLYNNVDGNDNISLGAGSLSNNISGSGNISFGFGALSNNLHGNDNIAIGNFALLDLQQLKDYNNVIAINASSSPLDAPNDNSFYVNPVRTVTALNANHYPLYYDEVTNEIVYYKPP